VQSCDSFCIWLQQYLVANLANVSTAFRLLPAVAPLLLLPILPIPLLLLQAVAGIGSLGLGPCLCLRLGSGLTFGKYVWTRGARGPWLADSLLVGSD